MSLKEDASVVGTWDRSTFNGRHKVVSNWLDLRWAISRFAHFSKVTFFNQHTGPVTPFELGFIAFAAVVSIILVIVSDKTTSGQITQYMIFISVLIALKTNALHFTLGVSWERAILIHKSVSTVSLVCACLHGIPQLTSTGNAILADTKQMSGLIMILLLGMQPLMYVILKPWNFEVFYYLHLAVYVALVVFAIIHGAMFVLYSIIIFGVDLLIRFILSARRTKLSIEKKAGDVVSITFEKRWNYHPGQFVFVMIPALGVHEWHPFSISSAPHELLVSLHVGVSGGWTEKLTALAGTSGTVEVTAFVEGPYGIPSVNFEDSTYQIALLISGSIGVTPNQSIANDLLEAHEHGRPLKKVVYVWAMRENKLGLVETMRQSGQLPGSNSGASVTPVPAVPAAAKAEEEEKPSFGKVIAGENILEMEIYCTNSAEVQKKTAVIPQAQGEVELTMLESPALTDCDRNVIRHGRPDLGAIFARVKELAVLHKERRVAVSVCGPASLVESTAAACRCITSAEVQFDIHIEKFNL